MVMVKEEDINAIRKACNIVDIISSYIPVTLKGKDYKCVCPFHDDHSPSMSISTSKQIYKCFSCGAAGNVFTFVENYEHVSFGEAVRIVAEKIGYNLAGAVKQEIVYKYQKEYDLMDLVNKYYENNINTKSGLLAKEYLHKRGLNDDNIKEFRIGVSTDEKNVLTTLLQKKGYQIDTLLNLGLSGANGTDYYDVFRGRITFPLCDDKGHIVGYSARIYRGEELAKYINTKETYIYKKGDFLYNYHLAREEAKRLGKLIIVEGQMDAIRIYINGVKNVVALMGTALTNEQVNLIKALRCSVILALDGDSAGATATLKNGEILIKAGINVEVVRISLKKDPDEYILSYGIESYMKNVDNAISFFDFKLSAKKADINVDNSVELTGYINDALESIKDMPDAIAREVALTKLANSVDFDKEVLKERLNELVKLVPLTKEVFKQPVKEIESENILDRISKKILYYMLNDRKYVILYQEKIGFFPNKIYRSIANEIVYFVNKNYNICPADFISYISLNEELNNKVLEIIQDEEEVSDDNFLLCIKNYKKQKDKIDIERLQQELRKELDRSKKLEIANRIREIKKESVG